MIGHRDIIKTLVRDLRLGRRRDDVLVPVALGDELRVLEDVERHLEGRPRDLHVRGPAPELLVVTDRRGEHPEKHLADYSGIMQADAHLHAIVVDDGSSDGTAAVAESAARDSGSIPTRVIRYEENRGKGYAVRAGLLAAGANIAAAVATATS